MNRAGGDPGRVGGRGRAGDARPGASRQRASAAASAASDEATAATRTSASATAPRPRQRPGPDQPLRARWDPTDDTGRARANRDPQSNRKKQSAVGRFVTTYGWRAYAIPVLAILTIVLVVLTVRDSDGLAMSEGAANPDAASRNTNVNEEAGPIGAPTGDIQEASLPAGTLPDGGDFTPQGEKVFHTVPGQGEPIGSGGQEYTYTVEVENGLNAQHFGGDGAFARMVDATLSNPRGWIGDGRVTFRRVDGGEPDLRISLTSPGTTRELCGYQIQLETSCFYPPNQRVILNLARWVRGALAYQGDDLGYRQYLINHEVGHGIGYEAHEPCREDGALAPIMMQQSFGVANREIMALDPQMNANPNFVCQPNPWPFPG